MKRILFFLLVAMLWLLPSLHSQNTGDSVLTDHHTDWCGFNPLGDRYSAAQRGGGGGPVLAALPTTLPPGSTVICGKFRAIFMDVVNATGFGFDDPTLGTTRKNCVCDVLNYIQSVITLPANIGTTDPYVDILFNPSTNLPLSGTLASAALVFPPAFYAGTAGYYQGHVYTYITTGVKPDPLSEDGLITVNFGHPYGYCTPTINNCDYDFYSVILHEMTHLLGFASLIRENSVETSLESAQGPNIFTEFDRRFLYYWNGASYDKLADIGLYAGNGGINPAVPANPFSMANADRIWLQNQNLTTTRDNQPIESTIGFAFGRSLSHYDIKFNTSGKRCNASPGFVPNYLMSASASRGRFKRTYTNQELRWLQLMGYTMSSSYPSNALIPNRPPLTLGNVANPLSAAINATPTCSNPDLYIATTTCQPVTINIATNTISTASVSHTLGLNDPDGDAMTVFNGQLINLRGCGNGGNNHNQLTINGSNTIITFTPRTNFIGRAQFAFHLYDGKERGTYIVISIDVTADGCTMNTSGQYVMNGGFEEGQEINAFVNPTVSIVEETDAVIHYNWNRFIDGLQFVSQGWQDLSVKESWVDCLYGSSAYSFPAPAGGPSASVNGDRRFIQMSGMEDFNITLLPAITSACGPYTLSVDVRYEYTVPIGTVYPLTFSFTSTIGGATFVNPVTFNVTNTGGWQTLTTTFSYTGAPMSYLHIDNGAPLSTFLFIDNVSIVKATNPVTVAPTSLPSPACVGFATVHAANASGGAAPYSYAWTPGGSTSASFSTTYPAPGVNNYTVVVTDANGCVANGTLAVNVQPNATIAPAPPATMCSNSAPVTLTGSPAGGTWSGTGISASGVFDPALAIIGTNTITYSVPGYCSQSASIEVTNAASPWPKHPVGSSKEEFRAIVKTSGGDVIAAGLFIKDVTISGYPTWNVTNGNGQLMVCRYNSNCVPVWAVNLGNVNGNENMTDMEIDASGNVFISGSIPTTTTFGAFTLTGPAAFILKLNGTTGAVMAAYASSVNTSAVGSYLAVDGSGNVYMEGMYNGTIQFGALPTITSSTTLNDIFVARFSSTLVPTWCISFGSTAADYPGGLAANSGTVVYAAANIGQSFSIGASSFTNTTINTTDVFIGRFNTSNGSFVTGRMAGNGTNNCAVRNILLDASSNVYFTGSFQGTLPVAATALSASSNDIFIGRWTSTLVNSWAYSMGGTSGDAGSCIALDGAGNVYFAGNYFGAATFTGFTPSSLTGGSNVFVVKLTAAGVKSYAAQSTTSSGTIVAGGITVMSSGMAYIAGHFSGTVAFGATPSISATVTDGYVARLNASGSFFRMLNSDSTAEITAPIDVLDENIVDVYPNPTDGIIRVQLPANNEEPSPTIQLLDASGRVLDVQSNTNGLVREIDLSRFDKGLYFLVINYSDKRIVKKVLVDR